MKRRVVITGLGPIAPCGIGKEEFWEAIKSGKSYTKPLKSFDICDLNVVFNEQSKFQSQVIGYVPNFESKNYLNPQQARRMDRFAQFAFVASKLAIDDAGINFDEVDRERVGVSIGTAIAGAKRMNEEFEVLTELGSHPIDPLYAHPNLYINTVPSLANTEVASYYKLNGPSVCVSVGCTSGIDSIGYAKELIERGDADIIIAGGVDAAIAPATIASFDIAGALAKCTQEHDKASRPFDKDRNGFVLAEGGGVLILESLEHALKRNAVIYAEVFGYGTCANAYHMTALREDGLDLARSMEIAIEKSNIDKNDIQYINAHGSSTVQNDKCETGAYKKVFGDYAYKIPISSNKSANGHSMGGASSMETIICALSVYHDFLTPTVNYENPDPDCDLDYIPNVGREVPTDMVITTASSFSGIHSSLVLGKYKV